MILKDYTQCSEMLFLFIIIIWKKEKKYTFFLLASITQVKLHVPYSKASLIPRTVSYPRVPAL